MNRLILIITFAIFPIYSDATQNNSQSGKVHIANQVGVSILEEKKYYLIFTKEGDLFIAEPGSQVISKDFEFTITSAKHLPEDNNLIAELGLGRYKNDKYFVQGIKVKSILLQMSGKCFRSNAETKELTPCDDNTNKKRN